MSRFKGRKKVGFFSPFRRGHVLSGVGRKGSYGFLFLPILKRLGWVGCGGVREGRFGYFLKGRSQNK